MAVKVFYTLNIANANWGQLQDGGSAPAAAASAYGWTPAKVALGYWRGRVGAAATATASQAATWLGAASLAQGTGTTNTTASNAFRAGPYNGSFANTTWPFSFGVRTGAASHAGRIRIQIWKGANATGSGATKVGGIGIGSIATLAATATTYTTSGSVAAPGVITLNNEYLFFEVEWQGTTVGTSNSCTTLFYQGVCSFTTPDFTLGAVSGILADTDDPDIADGDGLVGLIGTLADGDDPDTADLAGEVEWPPIDGVLADTDDPDSVVFDGDVTTVSLDITGTLGVTDTADTASASGVVGLIGTLGASDGVDTCNANGVVGRLGTLGAADTVDLANLSASVRWNVTLSATEALDTAANTGTVRWLATLAANEAPDVAVIAGPIPITGTLDATETIDTSSIAGNLTALPATGTLAATELKDAAALTASAYSNVVLAALEVPDSVAITAMGSVAGVLLSIEGFDVARLTGKTILSGGANTNYSVWARKVPVDVIAAKEVMHARGTKVSIEMKAQRNVLHVRGHQ